MNAKLYAAAAAALSLVAASAQASPDRNLQAFLDDTYSQAGKQLAGVDLSRSAVKVRAFVDAEGRLTGVRVVGSSGSRDADDQVASALKRVRVHYVPPALVGAQLNLAFGGPADTRLAKAP